MFLRTAASARYRFGNQVMSKLTSYCINLLTQLGAVTALLHKLDQVIDLQVSDVSTTPYDFTHFCNDDDNAFQESFANVVAGGATSRTSILFQMAYVYVYGETDYYFSAILREILRAKPELLLKTAEGKKADEEVKALSVQDVVKNHRDPTNLLHILIDRKVRNYGYQSISERLDYFRTLEKKKNQKKAKGEYDLRLEQISAIRNCVVHNNAIADEKLHALCPFYQVGTRIEIQKHTVSHAITALCRVSIEIDAIASRLILVTEDRNA